MPEPSSVPWQSPSPDPVPHHDLRPPGDRPGAPPDGTGPDIGRRLRGLAQAHLALTADLTLGEVLTRIVRSARDLLDATYAALGVLGDDGRLAEFVHLGMDDRTATALGDLPQGDGILGLLVDDPRPLRIDDLGAHPASAGLPAGHPPMRSFIGAPIRMRDNVFGNIYLTDKRGGGGFTADDEELLVAMAASAALAVDHARLHDESARTQRWQQASARITTALLSQADPGDVLRMVMAEGRLLVDADDVHVTRQSVGHEETLQPLRIAGDDTHPARPTGPAATAGPGCRITVPLVVGAPADEVLVVSRRAGGTPFDRHDRESVERFSRQVEVALGLQRARDDRERVRTLDEHHRIARDMHDHVIGRLVGSGMALQALRRYVTDPAGLHRLAVHLDDLDSTVRDIRTLIYGLDGDPAVVWTLSARVTQVVDEAAGHLGFPPDVDLDVVEPAAGSPVTEHLLGVLREALANVVRHADASSVRVTVSCGPERVDLTVVDDGRGPPARRRATTTSGGHGLVNMAERAAALGGRVWLQRNASGGATLRWSVPAVPSAQKGPGDGGAPGVE